MQSYLAWLSFTRNPLAMLGLVIIVALMLMAAFAPLLATHHPNAQVLQDRLLPPGAGGHLLGADELGRDIWSRIVYGARTTLTIVALVTLTAPVFGLVVGTAAGYLGGWTDRVLMRITDIFMAFPRLILALAFVAALGAGIENAVLAMTGCSLPHRNPMPDVHSFFVPDSDGVTQYELLSSEADHLLATCSTTQSCDRAHFLRGMVALYENRDVAASHFQVAAAIAPGTNTAASSLLWLQLLTEAKPYSGRSPFGRATAQLVRELLKQELTVRQMLRNNEGTDIAVLKRELQAKDKRMEELTKELASSMSSALQRDEGPGQTT